MEFTNNTITLDNYCLLKYEEISLNITIDKKNITLISGTVYNPKNEVVKNACIEVIRLNTIDNTESVLGYNFTNDKGKYGFVLEIDRFSDYIFNVYSPI